MRISLLIIAVLIIGSSAVKAQPFRNEINAFKKQDSLNFPPGNAILFIGSSSFTKWTDVKDYFPEHTIINRGFGGSLLTDQLRYEAEIIFPYQPKQIVIYCGENDLASSDTVTGQRVFDRFRQLFTDIRSKLPSVQVTYISMKPSPSRKHLFNKMEIANHLIKDFLEKQSQTNYVDVFHRMLDAEGKPIQTLFVEDNLHMNKNGYAIWQKLIEPYLEK